MELPRYGSLYAKIGGDRIRVYSARRNFLRAVSIRTGYNTITGLGDGDGVVLTQYNPSFFMAAYKNGGTRFTAQLPAASCGATTISKTNLTDIVIFDKFGSQIPFPLEVDLPCKGALNGRYSYVTNDFFIMCTDLVYAFCVSSKY